MDFNFTIQFSQSRSSEYDRAAGFASGFDKFTPVGADSEFNRVETDNHEVLDKFDLFQELMATIANWKIAKVIYRSSVVEPAAFFQSVKNTAECYQGFALSKHQTGYCQEGKADCWGCRQLSGIVLHHDAAPFDERSRYWYRFGEFTSKSVWTINKETLTQALINISELKRVDFCPIFQFSFFRRLIAALPTAIDASDTGKWGKVYLEETVSDVRQWKAINIYHKVSSAPADKPQRILVRDKPYPAKPTPKPPLGEKLRQIPETTFEDIGGISDIIQLIREVIELPIKRPELYDYLGIRPYRGILLWGEPGNGKTLIAKAIAHEVKAHFIPIIGPDILNKSFGESEKNLRAIFGEASRLQPAIIFFDEIDSIAQSRLAGETTKWYATVVNQLLSLMDGIREFGNVTVIASTNRPDLLDPALMRQGRFDYKLEVKKPNLHGCLEVLQVATRGMPLADDVDLFALAEAVIGLSAAEITFIAKEAALIALRRTVDVNSMISGEKADFDLSRLYVKWSDFISSVVILKRNTKYTNKTYSLKG